jgi:hypothetical protein
MCRGLKGRLLVLFLIFGLIFVYSPLHAREKQEKKKLPRAKSYTVSPAVSSIQIDGVLNEEAWKHVEIINLPYESYPGENIPAPVKTECLITFDKSKLYIGFRCFDPEPGKIRAHLMDRDDVGEFSQDDHVAVTIDTFNDERRAFRFAVSSLGVQTDALFSEIDRQKDYTWDAIWKSAAKKTDFGYVVELAVPFTQLRFRDTTEKLTWGFSIERSYPRTDAVHSLTSHVKDRNIVCLLCQVNKIAGFEEVKPGRDLEFDPTLTAIRTDQREDFPSGKMAAGKIEVEPGLSARWGITPNLTMNAAVNPDFSQVEADAAQLEINKRFALYYPEKRPFFLEGKDFFYTPNEIVFTRTVFNPVWGARLTGKLGKSAVGLIITQDRFTNLLLPSNQGSFSISLDQDVFGGVFRYRRDVGKGSTLGALYTGRVGDDYHNHVGGVDGFIRLSNTKFFKFQLLHSNTDYPDGVAGQYGLNKDAFGDFALHAGFTHAGRSFAYIVSYDDLGKDFRADYGFVPRVDTRRFYAAIQPTIWGKPGGWFERIDFGVTALNVTDHDGTLTDRQLGLNLSYLGPLQSNGSLGANLRKEYYSGITYDLNSYYITFGIGPSGAFYYDVYFEVGDTVDYDNAREARSLYLENVIKWRFAGRLNLDFSHIFQGVSLGGEKIFSVHLLQARLGYHFNVRTFLRAIVQYTDISQNPALYTYPVDSKTRVVFTQFLFSYKLNPRTVLFLGYSDNSFGFGKISLTRNDRTFFLKIGYALAL